MKVSIIIPTYNHAALLPDAIECALGQTVACEVIVIDDGSTDETAAVLKRYGDRIRAITIPHSGPSAARNRGIEEARGEFVMFLDADDLIAPEKVTTQLAEMTDEIGWVLCDVMIKDQARGTAETASVKYGYAQKSLGGWIKDQLARANFIPIMSPLIRRNVLGDTIRFHDERVPEDWHFWHEVAGAARVRYVPKVLATYRHQRTGRSRLPKKARAIVPNITLPLRLNLGCGTPNTRSWHPIPGMVNLDKSIGWTFEEGLGDFVSGSVAGISISHSLMYVALEDWPRVFAEFARVLEPGGVLRITEDDATNPDSSRRGGWKGSMPAVTLTDAEMVREHMERAGMRAYDVTKDRTHYRDGSLKQAQHGEAPECFWIEGVRQSAVLFSPHADDEALFASFLILKYRPRVVICHGSERDYGDTATREQESREAVDVLGGGPVEQWNGGDLVKQMRELDARVRPTLVFAPSMQTSHPDHVAVARAAHLVFGGRLTAYHTYDELGKVRRGKPATFEPVWVEHKLRALARYTSQIRHPRAHQFFMADLHEFLDA